MKALIRHVFFRVKASLEHSLESSGQHYETISETDLLNFYDERQCDLNNKLVNFAAAKNYTVLFRVLDKIKSAHPSLADKLRHIQSMNATDVKNVLT